MQRIYLLDACTNSSTLRSNSSAADCTANPTTSSIEVKLNRATALEPGFYRIRDSFSAYHSSLIEIRRNEVTNFVLRYLTKETLDRLARSFRHNGHSFILTIKTDFNDYSHHRKVIESILRDNLMKDIQKFREHNNALPENRTTYYEVDTTNFLELAMAKYKEGLELGEYFNGELIATNYIAYLPAWNLNPSSPFRYTRIAVLRHYTEYGQIVGSEGALVFTKSSLLLKTTSSSGRTYIEPYISN